MLEEKIKALETDLYLMAKVVTEALVDGVRALEDETLIELSERLSKMMKLINYI